VDRPMNGSDYTTTSGPFRLRGRQLLGARPVPAGRVLRPPPPLHLLDFGSPLGIVILGIPTALGGSMRPTSALPGAGTIYIGQ
jgi:hypothetical protein